MDTGSSEVRQTCLIKEICKKYVLPSFEESRMRSSGCMAMSHIVLVKTMLLIVVEKVASKPKSP